MFYFSFITLYCVYSFDKLRKQYFSRFPHNVIYLYVGNFVKKNKKLDTHIHTYNNNKIFKRENVMVELVYNNKIMMYTDLIW